MKTDTPWRVRIIDYVPTVNKKIKTAADVDVVLNAIREKLLAELENNDEIDVDLRKVPAVWSYPIFRHGEPAERRLRGNL